MKNARRWKDDGSSGEPVDEEIRSNEFVSKCVEMIRGIGGLQRRAPHDSRRFTRESLDGSFRSRRETATSRSSLYLSKIRDARVRRRSLETFIKTFVGHFFRRDTTARPHPPSRLLPGSSARRRHARGERKKICWHCRYPVPGMQMDPWRMVICRLIRPADRKLPGTILVPAYGESVPNCSPQSRLGS